MQEQLIVTDSTFWIHQHSWQSYGWHSAAWQSDSVTDWLFGATGPKIYQEAAAKLFKFRGLQRPSICA